MFLVWCTLRHQAFVPVTPLQYLIFPSKNVISLIIPNHAALFQSIFILRGTGKACSSELSNYTLTNPPFNLLPWETDLHFWIKASNATSSQKNSKCITPDHFLLKWLPQGRSPSSTSFSSCILSGTVVYKLAWQYFCCVKSSNMQRQPWKVKENSEQMAFNMKEERLVRFHSNMRVWKQVFLTVFGLSYQFCILFYVQKLKFHNNRQQIAHSILNKPSEHYTFVCQWRICCRVKRI